MDIQQQKAETIHSNDASTPMFHDRDVVFGMALIVFPSQAHQVELRPKMFYFGLT